MVHLLVDTCVWLDLPKDLNQLATLSYLEKLCDAGDVSLIVPSTVLIEFTKNKPRIATECGQSLSSVLKRAKDALRRLSPKKAKKALEQLDDMDYKLPTLGEAAVETLGRIEQLLKRFPVVEASDAIMLRAAKRAMAGIAPCHRGVNSIQDAIIFETYLDAIEANGKGNRFMFVTHNKKDFSPKDGDHRKPHPDLARYFSKIKSRFSISLVEAIRRIRPDLHAELKWEINWTEEMRPASEIIDVIGELIDKVWYNRHKCYEYKIKQGKIKLVETYNPQRHNEECMIRVLESAQKSAKKMERKYGLEELGPWTDFEWGMLNGKLSALRWALGDEWDMLDT